MKKEGLMWIGISTLLLIGLWKGMNFRKVQESSFNSKASQLASVQKQIEALREGQTYLHDHQTEFKALSQKKWFSPENRLIAGEIVETVGNILFNMRYTFEPERIMTLEKGYHYKASQIIIDVEALMDTDVYSFIDDLIKKFPGILHIVSIHLALNEGDPPPYVKGVLIFEWFTMGEK